MTKLTAVRWLRNGDHPADGVGQDRTDPLTGETYKGAEGAVVRFFRNPDFPGDRKHDGPGGCWERWRDHGWIDDAPAGIIVCPGDLVVDLPDGGHEVLKLGQGAHRDRNDHYVPAGLSFDGKAQYVEVTEGNQGRSAETLEVYTATAAMVIRGLLDLLDGGDGRVAPGGDIVHAARQWLKTMAEPAPYERARPAKLARLAMALPDELNREAGHWWWADLSAVGEEPGTHWSAFRGHRVQVDIELHTSNRREVNEWKGRDEIRAGGEWTISLNRQQVYDGHLGTDVAGALRTIERKVAELTDDGHTPLDHTDPRPYAEQLLGRRVYYHDTPAVVSSASVLHQGCVMLKPVGRNAFPRQGYDLDREPDGTGHGEQDSYDEFEAREVKVEIDSPHIWWWRDRPYSPDEQDGRYHPKRSEETGVEIGEAPEVSEASGNPVSEDARPGQRPRWKPLGKTGDGGTVFVAPLDIEVEVPRGQNVIYRPLPPIDEATVTEARESVPVEADDETDDDAP